MLLLKYFLGGIFFEGLLEVGLFRIVNKNYLFEINFWEFYGFKVRYSVICVVFVSEFLNGLIGMVVFCLVKEDFIDFIFLSKVV